MPCSSRMPIDKIHSGTARRHLRSSSLKGICFRRSTLRKGVGTPPGGPPTDSGSRRPLSRGQSAGAPPIRRGHPAHPRSRGHDRPGRPRALPHPQQAAGGKAAAGCRSPRGGPPVVRLKFQPPSRNVMKSLFQATTCAFETKQRQSKQQRRSPPLRHALRIAGLKFDIVDETAKSI